MNWELIVRDKSKKALKKLPQEYKKHIIKVLDELSVNPCSGDIEKIEGEEDCWRRRIGNYRIFYEINTKYKIIFVYDIKRRTSTTYN